MKDRFYGKCVRKRYVGKRIWDCKHYGEETECGINSSVILNYYKKKTFSEVLKEKHVRI